MRHSCQDTARYHPVVAQDDESLLRQLRQRYKAFDSQYHELLTTVDQQQDEIERLTSLTKQTQELAQLPAKRDLSGEQLCIRVLYVCVYMHIATTCSVCVCVCVCNILDTAESTSATCYKIRVLMLSS